MEPSSISALFALQTCVRDGSLQHAVRRRTFGNALDRVKQSLEAHAHAAQRLEALADVTAELRHDLDPGQRDQVLAKVSRLRTIAAVLRQEVTAESLAKASQALADGDLLVQDIEGVLKIAWQRRLTREFGHLDQLGGVLEQIAPKEDLGPKMRGVAQGALRLGAKFPPGPADLAALASALRDRDVLLNSMTDGADGVSTFLLKVASKEATLEDVDESTLVWLKEKRALRRFWIGVK
ncbi:hypothetical protein [Nannocystis pusilla]|uniref:hypothetical protein n=1 Tax=Nannocystis pusilla TaxID=889268 RepID=UPI003BF339B7